MFFNSGIERGARPRVQRQSMGLSKGGKSGASVTWDFVSERGRFARRASIDHAGSRAHQPNAFQQQSDQFTLPLHFNLFVELLQIASLRPYATPYTMKTFASSP